MVVDLHEDIAYYFMMSGAASDVRPFDEDLPGRHADLPKYKKAGMAVVLGSIFPMVGSLNIREIAKLEKGYGVWGPSSSPASPRDVAIEQVKIYYSLESLYPKRIKIVRTMDDLETLGNRTGILLHLEGSEALGEPEDLKVFFNLGVRSLGLTWNYDNKYAAACMSRKDYGLTGEGEDLVKAANDLGLLVDLSHASPRTCEDALALSESPPFFSHSNSLSVQESRRNVADSRIRRVAKRGGVVGLTFIRSCIGKPYTPEKLAEHAQHLIRLGGTELPALGTDFLGMSTTPQGLEDVSKLGRFRKALMRLGITRENVDGILHDNAYGFIHRQADSW